MLPLMKKRSWGTPLSRDRSRDLGDVDAIDEGGVLGVISSRRKSAMTSELFPLPVGPQIQIFSPGLMDMLTRWRIGGPEMVYDAERSLNSTAPHAGQLSKTGRLSPARPSLGVSVVKFFNLDTAPIDVSRDVHCLAIQAKDWLRLITLRIANPTYPGLTESET